MGLVVKDGEFGSLCRPYRAPGSAPGKPRAKALGHSLPPLRGSGGRWLTGEGSSVPDRIRIRHLTSHTPALVGARLCAPTRC